MNRYRHENKYLLNSIQENILLTRARAIMSLDSNVNKDGTYFIRSLYFDDLNETCFMENENGTDPRSKFRIRYYNNDLSFIKLEKKIKNKGMTFKESCSITKEECLIFMSGKYPIIAENMSEKKIKLFTELMLRKMKPKVIVSYERIPFIYEPGNVRITFDRKISSSNEIKKFLEGDYIQRPILPLGYSLLEVKWDEILPKFIKKLLNIGSLQWTSFSKYYLTRKYHI